MPNAKIVFWKNHHDFYAGRISDKRLHSVEKNWLSIQFNKLFGKATFDSGAFATGNNEGVFNHSVNKNFQSGCFCYFCENELTMAFLRILLLAFNTAIVTFLVYRLLQIYRSASANKTIIIVIGIFLLLLPITVLIEFIRPTAIYILLYPIAISLFIYLIKSER